jgi:hypothetical protein
MDEMPLILIAILTAISEMLADQAGQLLLCLFDVTP